MKNQLYKEIIEDYIRAYNVFDVEKMLLNMHDNMRFENITDGKTDCITNGIDELRTLAVQAAKYFKERKQQITDIKFNENIVEISVDYFGILAADIPNGMKAGDKIELNGRSVFRFENDKIIDLKDII